nr:efflux RND transporter periplasmic adaptor subunit [Oceanococcus sp. HetDA_MAG_MS8]
MSNRTQWQSWRQHRERLLSVLTCGAAVLALLPPAVLAKDGACPDGSAPEYWVAPMDPNYRRTQPGKSPMGMDLVPQCATHAALGSGVDLKIAAAVQQNLGLRTATVEHGVVQRALLVGGLLEWHPDLVEMVHVRAEGWITELAVSSPGAHVEQAQTLLRLFSPALATAEREFLAVANNAALRAAASMRLKALGYSPAQVEDLGERGAPAPTLDVLAPRRGLVWQLPVHQGEFVKPGTHVFTLVDPSQLWLALELPPSAVGMLVPGDEVELELPQRSIQTMTATVVRSAPSVDPLTRNLRVWVELNNTDGQLKAGEYALARIRRVLAHGLRIPRSAVIQRGGQDNRVIVAVGAEGFRVQPVELGAQGDEFVHVLGGLKPKDRVVRAGQFLIDSEANLDAEALRLRAAEPPQGRALAVIRGIDEQRRELVLEHADFEPVGEHGIRMPGMTMGFSLHPEVSLQGFGPGDSVAVLVDNPEAGVYRVLELERQP